MNPLRSLFVTLSRIPPAFLLVIIVGAAIMAYAMVTNYMGETKRRSEENEIAIRAKYEQKAKCVFATKDIPEGATISADSLEEKDIEAGKVPQDALASSSMAVGRIAKYGIPTGQLVSSHDLAPIGVSVGFDSKIKEGQRAITFAVDKNSGVAGFVGPGSHVDIIASVGSGNTTKASAILSDVEVIAVGQTYQRTSGATSAVPTDSVTVACAPDDANKLIRGVMAGKLYLTLRNDKDHAPVAVVDVTTMFTGNDTMAQALPPPGAALPPPPSGMPEAAPPPPPLHEIEAWSGSKKEVISVPKN